ncbi:MAG TPA: PD-(D/E)XK nuclease family protein [Candidatus Binatia bacterium]|nr:PD-(D/E)XK nuclease family protein [Candidatus Binatia bacterium]
MAKRVQSPSSINLFKTCPRKYYYVYVKGFELLPSIHTARGHVAHSVLEHFFDIDTQGITKENCRERLQGEIPGLLVKYWQEAKAELDALNLSPPQLQFYFEETLVMLFNWLNHFVERIQKHAGDFATAFKALTPVREKEYVSQYYSVHGFIDAIEHAEDGVVVMDYKTSKNPVITPEYRLQLAIYSLLYQETHGAPPKKVGVYFLKDKAHFLNVDQDLLDLAKKEIELVHQGTTTENVVDYEKTTDKGACRWCEFHELCWGTKNSKSQFLGMPGMRKNR